ncbi:7309_t:CDS:2, partial [Paraglomus occultum]
MSTLLSRENMLELLLLIIKEVPKLSNMARNMLIEFCQAIGETATVAEISVLLRGLLVSESFLRHACLQALEFLDLTPKNPSQMADHHTDDLIDYEEEEQLLHTEGASTHKQNNYNEATEEDKKDKKGSYVGVHATGFRDFLLKPELLRAIVDC